MCNGTRLAHPAPEGGHAVELSIPIALMLGVVVLALVRKSGLKVVHALAAIMLGFYLYSTTFAGQISQLDNTIASIIGGSIH
jgi:hypothetical protein